MLLGRADDRSILKRNRKWRKSSNWSLELDDVVQVGHASAALRRRLLEDSLDEAHARHETVEHLSALLNRLKLGNRGLDQGQECHQDYGTMYLHWSF